MSGHPKKLDVFGTRATQSRGFWAGRAGLFLTLVAMCMVVALLVGWILLWVYQPKQPNVALLTLGCIAFGFVLVLMATVQFRLRSYWQLRQSQAAYLMGMSHTLRTPVASIRAAAQALQNPKITEDQQNQLLHGIVLETRLLGLRIDNVLETGRLQVERTALLNQPLDFSSLARKALATPAEIAASRGGLFETEVDDALTVRGDARTLRLVIDNILDNAIKYCDGSPKVTVSVKKQAENVRFDVVDKGMGMDHAELNKAFKRFWGGSRSQSGSGLGLWLARAIARGHGGEVTLVNNTDGIGCTASFSLPFYDGVAQKRGT
ncbi:MAG: HAMP domain-containing sensor histidine kinase [Myxococcota bacterium]|nr:HAMP domain-containing sensor histidine kinase [Myxococcota bacterium]